MQAARSQMLLSRLVHCMCFSNNPVRGDGCSWKIRVDRCGMLLGAPPGSDSSYID